MTNIKPLYRGYFALEVPPDYKGGIICNNILVFNQARWISLPNNIEWVIIGMAKDLSEEQWDDIAIMLDMGCIYEAYGFKEETTLIIKGTKSAQP